METLAILVGGGPAPGINGVIASATIEAINNGLRVIGLYDGYRHIARGDVTYVRELTVDDVSRIHFTGGSIVKRRASGHDHGVMIVAEGIAERLAAGQIEAR